MLLPQEYVLFLRHELIISLLVKQTTIILKVNRIFFPHNPDAQCICMSSNLKQWALELSTMSDNNNNDNDDDIDN